MLKWAIAKEERRDGGAHQQGGVGSHCRSLSTSSSAQSSPSIGAPPSNALPTNAQPPKSSSLLTLRKRRKLSHNNAINHGAQSADELEASDTRHVRVPGPTSASSMTTINVLSNHNSKDTGHTSIINGLRASAHLNNNNSSSKDFNADSKSLLYMSLDHLPLAIVKQYERMLQEEEEEEAENNFHGREHITGEKNGNHGSVSDNRVSNPHANAQSADACGQQNGKFIKKSKFKSKPGNLSKKVILPLHSSATVSAGGKTIVPANPALTPTAATSTPSAKGLSCSLSKFVKHGKGSKKKCSKKQRSSPTPPTQATTQPAQPLHDNKTEADNKPASGKTATKLPSSAPPRCTPSPTSMSIGSGTEMIRHARSRSLRTSFKTKENPEMHPTSVSGITASPEKSSTLPRSSKLNSSGQKVRVCTPSAIKSGKSRTSSQSTQTLQVKSILKNPLELNNNHLGVANQNSIQLTTTSRETIENPTKKSSTSSSSSSSSSTSSTGSRISPGTITKIADLSTICHPPTPIATLKSSTTRHRNPFQPQLNAAHLTKEAVRSLNSPSTSGGGIILSNGKKYEDDHDTTDPQFLETSLTFSFPAVARRAKKLTLKRSELRKLERIRSQTDRLNRFLRKYYHECLPNLPEEEDSNCSPEEKSLAILKNYLGDENNRFRGHGTRRNLADLLNEAAFSGIITNSSSSFSSSGSTSSSSCSSSSSSDYSENWVASSTSSSSAKLRSLHFSSKRHYHHGNSSAGEKSSRRRGHHHRRAQQISGLYSTGRNILSPTNESLLLPSILEDSAEVSSASVKSAESLKISPRNPSSNNSHSDRLAELKEQEVRDDEGIGGGEIIRDERENQGSGEKHSLQEPQRSQDEYLRGTFVTEGTETDSGKLKGSSQQSQESFEQMPTIRPFAPNPSPSSQQSQVDHLQDRLQAQQQNLLQAQLQSQHHLQALQSQAQDHQVQKYEYQIQAQNFQQSEIQFQHHERNHEMIAERIQDNQQLSSETEFQHSEIQFQHSVQHTVQHTQASFQSNHLDEHHFHSHDANSGFHSKYQFQHHYENTEEMHEAWRSQSCTTPELFPECGDTGSIGSAGSSTSSHGYGSGSCTGRSDPTTPTVIILDLEDGNYDDGVRSGNEAAVHDQVKRDDFHKSYHHQHLPPSSTPQEISLALQHLTDSSSNPIPCPPSSKTIPLSAGSEVDSNANYPSPHHNPGNDAWNSGETPSGSPCESSEEIIMTHHDDDHHDSSPIVSDDPDPSEQEEPQSSPHLSSKTRSRRKCVRFSSSSPPPLLQPLKSSHHQVINNNCNPRLWLPEHHNMGGDERVAGEGYNPSGILDFTSLPQLPHRPHQQQPIPLQSLQDIHLQDSSSLPVSPESQTHPPPIQPFQPAFIPPAPPSPPSYKPIKLTGIIEENEEQDEQDYADDDEDSSSDEEVTGECSFDVGPYSSGGLKSRTPALLQSTPAKAIKVKALTWAKSPTAPSATPTRQMSRTPVTKKSTPRKLVRKPPVKSAFTGKGEVLIRSYSNGDYVTLHVVHAKNLQPSYRSSWKLAIKISLLPEAEATFTKSESVQVEQYRTWVKIDEKFSFESSKWIAKDKNGRERKVFLTFWKRQDKRTSFLGWTTVNVGTCLNTDSESCSESLQEQDTVVSLASNRSEKTWQSWLKLRKRKMSGATSNQSAASYLPAAYNAMRTKEEIHRSRNLTKGSPLPLEIETLEEIQSPDSQEDETHSHPNFPHHHHPDEIKSTVFPNSATMDSGVEDCCEPTILPPSIELDETQGKRVRVKMTKDVGIGFGFSVVWVSPPRIERLEKGKTADNAGLRIGDLIIGVNGEDVTTVPNTTIYHNMKTTGNELELEIWRKHNPNSGPPSGPVSNPMQTTTAHQHHHQHQPQASPKPHGNANANAGGGGAPPAIGSMVMMLMTGTGTPLKGGATPAKESGSNANTPKHQPKAAAAGSGGQAQNNPNHSSQNVHHHHSHHHHHQQQQQQLPPQQQPQHSGPVNTGSSNNNNINNVASVQNSSNNNNNHILPTSKYGMGGGGGATGNSNSNNDAHNHHTSSAPALSPPIRVQPPPVSILKPPPPAPPTDEPPLTSHLIATHHHPQPHPQLPPQRNVILGKKLPAHPQPTLASSSWKIRFNVELLDNEEDSLKQFFICELKYFRKVVAALDRYLIPAQANQMLTPQEIHSIFAHIITIITMTKRILQCVANSATATGWKLGDILFTTHSDHLSEIVGAYTNYARNLGNSSLILAEKMTIQSFARFVLETPVPKGHLDITSLLFAPLEHLRNLCEICDEIVHNFDNWTDFNALLKECYANIVVYTDFMEPISHISMKKHPLLSVRDLEKRIVSTTCQPLKVCEKGRKWLFGSRLFRKETDGSWAPVWAFLFTDIIVLTSHMTRDRVFFVKEPPIRLEDVVTLHFNLPRKNENEFRLAFGPEPPESHRRLDRILPLYRRQKSNQVVLRATNNQLKAMWKLLLQRQIITLNTRLSKSSSSNFSISEFCEKFPEHETTRVKAHAEKIDEEPEEESAAEEKNTPEAVKSPGIQATPRINRKVTSGEDCKDLLTGNGKTMKERLDESRIGDKKEEKVIPEKVLFQAPSPVSTSSPKPKQPSAIPASPAPSHTSYSIHTTPSKSGESGEKADRKSGGVNDTITRNFISTVPEPRYGATTAGGVAGAHLKGIHSSEKPQPKPLQSTTMLVSSLLSKASPTPRLGQISGMSSTSSCESDVPPPPPIVYSSEAKGQLPPLPLLGPRGGDGEMSGVKKVVVGKFVQKPVEMLSSPSEGSPRKYNLGACSNVTKPDSSSSTNNNNEKAKNLNRSWSKDSNPCECNSPSPSIGGTPTRKGNSSEKLDKEFLAKEFQRFIASGTSSLAQSSAKSREAEKSGESRGSIDGESKRNDSKKISKTDSKENLVKVKSLDAASKNGEGNSGIEILSPGESTTSAPTPSASASDTTIVSGSTSKNSLNKSSGNFQKTGINGHKNGVDVVNNNKGSVSLSRAGSKDTLIKGRISKPEEQEKSLQEKVGGGATEKKFLQKGNSELSLACKSPPGGTASKIITNSTLKHRQQQQEQQQAGEKLPSSLAGIGTAAAALKTAGNFPNKRSDSITTDESSAGSKLFPLATTKIGVCTIEPKTSSSSGLIHPLPLQKSFDRFSEEKLGGSNASLNDKTIRNVIEPSDWERQRMKSGDYSNNNDAILRSNKVHTSSPIVSGFGSDRSRRRLIVDYKVRRDYPELFGITPRDRRSFIKELGELIEEDQKLVAPYYYHTALSPLPKPRQLHPQNQNQPQNQQHSSFPGSNKPETGDLRKKSPANPISTAPSNNNSSLGATSALSSSASSTNAAPSTVASSNFLPGGVRSSSGWNNGKLNGRTINITTSIPHPAPGHKPLNNEIIFDDLNDDEEDDGGESDNSSNYGARLGELLNGKLELINRRRSPEESSSNDSGISEEILLPDKEPGKRESSNSQYSPNSVSESTEEKVRTERKASGARGLPASTSHSTTEVNLLKLSSPQCKNESDECMSQHGESRASRRATVDVACRNQALVEVATLFPSTEPPPLPSSQVQDTQNTSTNNPTTATLYNPPTFSSAFSTTATTKDRSLPPGMQEPQNENSIKSDQNPNPTVSNRSNVNGGENASLRSSCSSSSQSKTKMNHVSFVQGEQDEERAGGEPEGKRRSAKQHSFQDETSSIIHDDAGGKADKAIGTDDDEFCLDFTWMASEQSVDAAHGCSPYSSYKNILAEKREAFFMNQYFHQSSINNDSSPTHCSSRQCCNSFSSTCNRQNHSNSSTITTITSSSQHSSVPSSWGAFHRKQKFQVLPEVEAMTVKIIDGSVLHSTTQQETQTCPTYGQVKLAPTATCERVQYTRLEKEKTAKVERVESSDSSTSSSSDVASASPAAENGTTDPSWSSSSSSLAGYSSLKEEPMPSTSSGILLSSTSGSQYASLNGNFPGRHSIPSGYLDTRPRPEIVVTNESSPETPKQLELLEFEGDELEMESGGESRKPGFLRVESNDSTAENYGDDDDYNFDDEEEDLSHCSVATLNRYGTFESLEKIDNEEGIAALGEFTRNLPRSKARFTFDEDDDDDEDLFEEDFESDFNFRFPTQIQDNTYSVSRLGPLPPLLEEDYEDEMYDEGRASSESPSNSGGDARSTGSARSPLNQVHQAGVRSDGYLLARIATMYARSSISPLRIFRELLLKKRYRQWAYKE